jgi:peptidoglycan hydrolase CwlO-like protein
VKTTTHIRSTATGTLAALVLAVVLAGCGNAVSPAASPSTIYPQASATGTLPALKAYLTDVQDILGQMATTVGQLPGAVQGMSVKPDSTWQSAGAQLDSIAQVQAEVDKYKSQIDGLAQQLKGALGALTGQ